MASNFSGKNTERREKLGKNKKGILHFDETAALSVEDSSHLFSPGGSMQPRR